MVVAGTIHSARGMIPQQSEEPRESSGGTIVGSSQITGSIDNNVPFILNDYKMPSTLGWVYVPPSLPLVPPLPFQLPSDVTSNSQSLTPLVAGTASTPTYYVVSSLSGKLTVNSAGGADTYVAIRVNGGDITGAITVNSGVHLKIYFDYDINTKNNNLTNNSPTSTNPSAANMQFYGISP